MGSRGRSPGIGARQPSTPSRCCARGGGARRRCARRCDAEHGRSRFGRRRAPARAGGRRRHSQDRRPDRRRALCRGRGRGLRPPPAPRQPLHARRLPQHVRRARTPGARRGPAHVGLRGRRRRRGRGRPAAESVRSSRRRSGVRDRRRIEWLLVAGILGVLLRAPLLGLAIGGWLLAVILWGAHRGYADAVFWQSLAAAVPAGALVLSSLALLVPRLRPAKRRAPAPSEH